MIVNLFGYEITICSRSSKYSYTKLVNDYDKLITILNNKSEEVNKLIVENSNKEHTNVLLSKNLETKEIQISNLKKTINKRNKTIKNLLSKDNIEESCNH